MKKGEVRIDNLGWPWRWNGEKWKLDQSTDVVDRPGQKWRWNGETWTKTR